MYIYLSIYKITPMSIDYFPNLWTNSLHFVIVKPNFPNKINQINWFQIYVPWKFHHLSFNVKYVHSGTSNNVRISRCFLVTPFTVVRITLSVLFMIERWTFLKRYLMLLKVGVFVYMLFGNIGSRSIFSSIILCRIFLSIKLTIISPIKYRNVIASIRLGNLRNTGATLRKRGRTMQTRTTFWNLRVIFLKIDEDSS